MSPIILKYWAWFFQQHSTTDIVKAGVKANKVVAEKVFLLDAFEKNALVYFEMEDFPERYVRRLYKELEKGLSAKRAIRKNDSDEFQ
jgi:hypothetical protein